MYVFAEKIRARNDFLKNNFVNFLVQEVFVICDISKSQHSSCTVGHQFASDSSC